MMENKNPVFSQGVVGDVQSIEGAPMTVSGTMNKLILCMFIMIASGAAVWQQFTLGYMDKVNMLMMAGLVIGLISGFAIIFKRDWAPVLTPVYAFAEGALLGGLSSILEAQFKGIVVQAVALTFMAVLAMAILFKANIIRATEKFRSAIITATFAIAILYFISIIAGFFHIQIPAIYSSSPIGIAFSVIVCAIAAFNLILDFDFVEQGVRQMLPKNYEWYGAFGLMVTIVWLYVEILRLLSKLRDR
ncbi:MAG: Bax inhibitor-1/YccA family protein [Candidatus Gastranaerophilales bacterium]|nr:Bax inhibitor-1/YccA family protein [Candidatus Gastranaerophilales bacterium]